MKKPAHSSPRDLPQDKLEERRKRAAGYFRADKKVTWIAEKLGVSRVAVQQWKRRWREDGLAGLEHGKYGRSPKLTKHQETIIRRDMAKGAKSFGYGTDRWTLKKITSHVKKRLRVEYADRSVWHMLERTGLVPSKSASKGSGAAKPSSAKGYMRVKK